MMPFQAMRLRAAPADSPTDPDWSFVKSLLNMGGADGSTSFPDSTGLRTWAVVGNVQVDTSLGYNTALFDGSGDFIETNYVQADFDWWTSDYTIEAWVYPVALADWQFLSGPTAVPAMVGCASPYADVAYWAFGPIATGAIRFLYFNGSGQLVTSTGTIPEGALSHIALSKNSSGIHLAVNGDVEAPVAVAGTPQSSPSGVSFTLGQINNKSINGHIRALRVTKGVARYTSDFTPPDAPFPTS